MQSHAIHRRAFIKAVSMGFTGGLCLAPSLLAVNPFCRSGKPRLHLGLAAYGFRDFFVDASHEQAKIAPGRNRITLLDFIDWCADHQCFGAELTSYYFPKEVTPEFLLTVRRHAFLRGVVISGTAVGNEFTHPKGEAREKQIQHVKDWVDHAALMGAPHIRVFAGNAGRLSREQALKNCIEALEECGQYAGSKGVMLGIENHGGIVAEADALLEIVRSVNSPWVGINLDTGNFHTVDPYADLERCAPYAVNVQLKVEIQPRGQASKGPSDLPRLVDILRRANYQGFVVLEYEAAEDPFSAIPRHLELLAKLLA